MKKVYEAADNIEAHMLKGLLESEGIATSIDNEFHGSGLVLHAPTTGFHRMSVQDVDVERALVILREWDKKNPHDGPELVETTKADWSVPFLVGVFVGIAACVISMWTIS